MASAEIEGSFPPYIYATIQERYPATRLKVGQIGCSRGQFGLISVHFSVSTDGIGPGRDNVRQNEMSNLYPRGVQNNAHLHPGHPVISRYSRNSFGIRIAIEFIVQTAEAVMVSVGGCSLATALKSFSDFEDVAFVNGSCSAEADGVSDLVRMRQDLRTADNRRESPRYKINAPLTVIIGDNQIPAYTRDLSNRGVYFFLAGTDENLIDSEFEFVLELPPEVTLSTYCQVRCQGLALRKEKTSTDLTGVAAKILDYSILK